MLRQRTRGCSAYLAFEGGDSFNNRADAFRRTHKITANIDRQTGPDTRIGAVPNSVVKQVIPSLICSRASVSRPTFQKNCSPTTNPNLLL
jgi:hypothetical protein